MPDQSTVPIELEIRRALSDEIKAYRDYLEKMLRLGVAGIGIVLAIALAVFSWAVGNSKDDLQKYLEVTVSQSMREHAIDKALQKRLVDMAKSVALDDAVKKVVDEQISKDVIERVAGEVPPAVNKAVATAVASELEKQIKPLSQGDVSSLIQKAVENIHLDWAEPAQDRSTGDKRSRDLGKHDICFISKISLHDANDANCRIERAGDSWTLHANTGGGAQEVACGVQCANFRFR